jgi:hypothetical protein
VCAPVYTQAHRICVLSNNEAELVAVMRARGVHRVAPAFSLFPRTRGLMFIRLASEREEIKEKGSFLLTSQTLSILIL